MFMKQLNVIFTTFLYYIPPVLNAPLSSDDDDGSLSASENRRSLWSIPWSCLVTIVACTCLSVHLNVPGRKLTDKGRLAIVGDRAEMMAIAVLGPEVIVARAASQFDVAWKAYCLGTNPYAFAKVVSILQLSWFIIQCIARANQRLTITLLEVTALAFAVSSITASLLRFYKPFNVRYHIGVGPKSESVPSPSSATGNIPTRSENHSLTVHLSPSPESPPRNPIDLPPLETPLPPESVPSASSTTDSNITAARASRGKVTRTGAFYLVMRGYAIILSASNDDSPRCFGDGVPRFWVGGPSNDLSDIRAPTILAVGVLFEAIH
ncbi:hypothetical protein F5146DRAFT_1145258 [Armillaria mellea]|nr:hypothetical protein F5146DRAFT_1145258 [Armillaria mellea]